MGLLVTSWRISIGRTPDSADVRCRECYQLACQVQHEMSKCQTVTRTDDQSGKAETMYSVRTSAQCVCAELRTVLTTYHGRAFVLVSACGLWVYPVEACQRSWEIGRGWEPQIHVDSDIRQSNTIPPYIAKSCEMGYLVPLSDVMILVTAGCIRTSDCRP